MISNRLTLALVLLLALLPGAAAAQVEPQGPRGLTLERSELEAMLQEYETAATAEAYSGRLRERARREAELIRARLVQGDLQVGDRIILQVDGSPELDGEYTVAPGQVLELPTLGSIPLRGVLRAELEEHLETEIGRFIRDSDVTAQSLIRLSMTGEVNTPGFYVVPASSLLGDAIMLAGGPTRTANMEEMEIRRGDRVAWGGDALQEALVEGKTLDQLSVRAGDQIILPTRTPGLFSGGVIRTLLVTLPPLIFLAERLLR